MSSTLTLLLMFIVTLNNISVTNTMCCDCLDTKQSPGCSSDLSCQTNICAVDSWCCDNRWDKQCVIQAAAVCGNLCCQCLQNKKGETECKSDALCTQNICAIDPYCCNTQWDVQCVNKATNVCQYGTPYPTTSTSSSPTGNPITKHPSHSPTNIPSQLPSISPTTKAPTTSSPTASPQTLEPSTSPITSNPTLHLSRNPTLNPTDIPTNAPTKAITSNPTKYPTFNPTKYPTKYPTNPPTNPPILNPTKSLTFNPTKYPTLNPTKRPTKSPISDVLVIPKGITTTSKKDGEHNQEDHKPTEDVDHNENKGSNMEQNQSSSLFGDFLDIIILILCAIILFCLTICFILLFIQRKRKKSINNAKQIEMTHKEENIKGNNDKNKNKERGLQQSNDSNSIQSESIHTMRNYNNNNINSKSPKLNPILPALGQQQSNQYIQSYQPQIININPKTMSYGSYSMVQSMSNSMPFPLNQNQLQQQQQQQMHHLQHIPQINNSYNEMLPPVLSSIPSNMTNYSIQQYPQSLSWNNNDDDKQMEVDCDIIYKSDNNDDAASVIEDEEFEPGQIVNATPGQKMTDGNV